jgi:hypothetical protein
MPIAGCITLIVCGAILRFALTTDSVHGVNLQIVGVILMLAGAAGLLLRRWAPTGPRVDRRRRRSRQDAIDDGSLVVEEPSRVRRLARRRLPDSGRRSASMGPDSSDQSPDRR